MTKFLALLRMIKIEHSVFALPFAYLGLFCAARGWPGWRPFLLVALAMVAVRSFAMAVNRLADVEIDRRNPRTAMRPLVTGEIGLVEARVFALGMAALFVVACWAMNPLVLALSPVALAIAGGYSWTKRFTWLCHFVLGATLGLAPIAGWLAFDPVFKLGVVLFGVGVTFWVAGFDILYACQDHDFDVAEGLRSIPARFGLQTALTLSGFCHGVTAILFALAGWGVGLGWGYFAALAVVCGLLWQQHRLVRPDDLSRVNMAFFTLNGVVAAGLFAGALIDLFLLARG